LSVSDEVESVHSIGAHELPSPSHTSHSSYSAVPPWTPKQSKHVEPSPPHTLHASSTEVPKGTCAQSKHERPLPSQTLQMSYWALPFGTPRQSSHELVSEPHTPHTFTPGPLQMPHAS
jgi:hypothetical protein